MTEPVDDSGIREVVMTEEFMPRFEAWLASIGLRLAGPIYPHADDPDDPNENNPFWVITPTDEALRERGWL